MGTSTTHSPFIDELLAVLREHSYRDPMFDAVQSGSMSRTGLLTWTMQASLVVREFTRFISAIHSNCPTREAQQLLAQNLWEEHGQGAPERDHYWLIRKMARSLGASEQELDSISPLPETADYINHCLTVTRNASFIESITAVGLGIESFMPAFFGGIADSLCSRYGLDREDVEYLNVHVAEDRTHANRVLELIAAHGDTREQREKAKSALREMLSVKRRFSEAVYRHSASAVI